MQGASHFPRLARPALNAAVFTALLTPARPEPEGVLTDVPPEAVFPQSTQSLSHQNLAHFKPLFLMQTKFCLSFQRACAESQGPAPRPEHRHAGPRLLSPHLPQPTACRDVAHSSDLQPRHSPEGEGHGTPTQPPVPTPRVRRGTQYALFQFRDIPTSHVKSQLFLHPANILIIGIN